MESPASLAADGAIALGASALACWWAGRPELTALLPGYPPLLPPTALFFVLAGLSLRSKRPAARRLALAAAAVAAGALLERLAGLPFPLGHWLVPGLAQVPMTPSLPAGAAMALIAGGLLSAEVAWLPDLLGLAAAALGGLTLTPRLHHVFRGAAMALPAAFGCLGLGLSLVGLGSNAVRRLGPTAHQDERPSAL